MNDSNQETLNHISRVRSLIVQACNNLQYRASVHDQSKLSSPEKEAFDRAAARLRDLTYGSDAYKASLAELGDALRHHYRSNRHHPEFYALTDSGIPNPDELLQGVAVARMSLFDITEMLMDWKAASERHENGDIWSSLAVNKERFGLSEQLYGVLCTTAKEMGW